MQLRKHQVTITQGAAGTAQSTQHRSKLERQKIGLRCECFAGTAGQDNQAEEIDKAAGRTDPENSVDSKLAGNVTTAIVLCEHSDVGAFVKVLAFRKSSGIEGYLVALVVPWINQHQ